MLYSYKKGFPQELPFTITLENGLTLTEVNTFSNEKLKEMGFSGPHTIPDFDSIRQKIIWTGNQFEIENLPEDEIRRKCISDQNNYIKFYNLFNESDLCKNIEDKNKLNTILEKRYLEFKLLENEINYNFNTETKIFDRFLEHVVIFYNSYGISTELKIFLENLLIECNFYFLLDRINIEIKSYPSWVMQKDGLTMLPPVELPDNENSYIWDEEAYQLDNTNGWKLSN